MQETREENVEVLQKDLYRTKERAYPTCSRVNSSKDDPFNKCVLAQTALPPHIEEAREKGKQPICNCDVLIEMSYVLQRTCTMKNNQIQRVSSVSKRPALPKDC